ncbi:uncharacterized protein [Asterias amurensis]|uniref:uncharacterized protein n=1 Tax=Asterias amurensis TaxID=7602 RepID=UPI003AB709D7
MAGLLKKCLVLRLTPLCSHIGVKVTFSSSPLLQRLVRLEDPKLLQTACFLSHERRPKLKCTPNLHHVASFHCGKSLMSEFQINAPERHHSDDIVTYVKDEGDLQRLLGNLTQLLSTPDFAKKVKISAEDAKSKIEELTRLLLSFRADPKNIFRFLDSNPRVLNSNWDVLIGNIRYLNELQVFSNRILLVLDRNPKLFSARLNDLKERIRRLRKLGLREGGLQRVIITFPTILTLKQVRLNAAISKLRACHFASKQIATVIINAPQVLDAEPSDIERRFQYVYYMMGLTNQEDMVSANIFKYSLSHTRQRHILLERLGKYEMPDKKGQTRIDNPKLSRIVDCTDSRFAQRCAGIDLEEFEMFVKNLEAEDEVALDEEDEGRNEDLENEETDDELSDYDYTKDK